MKVLLDTNVLISAYYFDKIRENFGENRRVYTFL